MFAIYSNMDPSLKYASITLGKKSQRSDSITQAIRLWRPKQPFLALHLHTQHKGSTYLDRRDGIQATSTGWAPFWHDTRRWLSSLVHDVAAVGYHGENGFWQLLRHASEGREEKKNTNQPLAQVPLLPSTERAAFAPQTASPRGQTNSSTERWSPLPHLTRRKSLE